MQIKAVNPSILGQSSDPCSLLSLSVLQTVSACMTKYDVIVQLYFDSTIVNSGNYVSNYKSSTEKSLLQYTSALTVTTQALGRRSSSDFTVQATLGVRGESVAQALTDKLKNVTAAIAALNLRGLLGLSRPYYCLDVGGACAVSTTPAPAVKSIDDTGSGSGSSGSGVTPTPPQLTNATNSSFSDIYLATVANFQTVETSTSVDADTNASSSVGANHSAEETNSSSPRPARRLLAVQRLPRKHAEADHVEPAKRWR